MMLQIDIIGLIITIFFLGPQNILYIVLAIIVHELGRILSLLLLMPQLELMVTGGVLNIMIFKVPEPFIFSLLTILAGPFFCFLMGLICKGMNFRNFGFRQLNNLLNPFIKLKKPWAIINLRLALFSAIISLARLTKTMR